MRKRRNRFRLQPGTVTSGLSRISCDDGRNVLGNQSKSVTSKTGHDQPKLPSALLQNVPGLLPGLPQESF